MFKKNIIWFYQGLFFMSLLLAHSCSESVPRIFTIEDEVSLADQIGMWVASDTTFIVLDEVDYAESYEYSNFVLETVLGTNTEDSTSESLIQYRNQFEWRLYLLEDTEVNAFVTPGGHLYVNSGMIQILDNVDQFAGLVASLVAQADERHVTKQLFNFFTSQEMKQAANGETAVLEDLSATLLGRRIAFRFSNEDEQEADQLAVNYLSRTDYACDAPLGFYEILDQRESQGSPSEYYNAHSYEGDRYMIINSVVQELGCNTNVISESGFTFADLKNTLP